MDGKESQMVFIDHAHSDMAVRHFHTYFSGLKIFPANCTCLLIYIYLSLLTFLLSFKIEGMKVTTQPSFLLSLSPKKKKPSCCIIEYAPTFFFLDTCKGLTFHDKNHLFHANFLAWRKNFFFHFFFISPFLKRLHFYLSHIFFCLL